SQHRRFRERAVDDLELRLARADVVERHEALLVLLVDEHGMALREGTAPAVLAREAHERALGAERAEGERLAGRPVDALAALDRLLLGLELARDLAVEVKAVGNAHEGRADLLQELGRDAGIAAAVVVGGGGETGPGAFEPIGLVRLVALRRFVFAVE